MMREDQVGNKDKIYLYIKILLLLLLGSVDLVSKILFLFQMKELDHFRLC